MRACTGEWNLVTGRYDSFRYVWPDGKCNLQSPLTLSDLRPTSLLGKIWRRNATTQFHSCVSKLFFSYFSFSLCVHFRSGMGAVKGPGGRDLVT